MADPYLPNTLPMHGQPRDAETLGRAAADRAARVLTLREISATPMRTLTNLSSSTSVS